MIYGDLQFFDILIFAAIAGFIIYRLRSVLGKRTGFQKNISEPKPRENKKQEDLQKIPVLRKSELANKQKLFPPFGGFERTEEQKTTHFFQSPGPIYEPGTRGLDWGRFAPFLYATGVRKGMVLQNCFSYHLTPAGMMFEEGALKIGTKVIPAGTGQTELQAKAASFLKTNVYAGTPDFLFKILEKGDELNLDLTNIKIASNIFQYIFFFLLATHIFNGRASALGDPQTGCDCACTCSVGLSTGCGHPAGTDSTSKGRGVREP